MKNSLKSCFAILMLMASMINITSCNKFDDIDKYDQFAQPSRIGVFNPTLNLNVQGEEVYNIVTLNGVYSDWSVASTADWLTLQKGMTNENGKDEHTVKVKATPNTGYSRTGVVTVTIVNGDKTVSKTFNVVQASNLASPAVSLSEATIHLTAVAESKSVTLTTNQTVWTATTTADWLTLTQSGEVLTVAALKNTGMLGREAVVTIVAGTAPNTATTTLKVVQALPDNATSITVNGIELILVEKGSFMMGAQNTNPSAAGYGVMSDGTGYSANQSPIHKVTFTKDIYIGKYLITQAQWNELITTNPSRNVGNNNPVEYVDWNMANDYLQKLRTKTAKNFRLPTEAEWEYAARGGNQSNGYMFSGSNVASLAGNFISAATNDARNASRTTPGGRYLPNELGIYDMSGNLYEWCSDYFGNYSAGEQTDPTGAATGTNRVIRGASWWHLPTTVYFRGNNAPTYTGTHANAGLTGFRVVYVP